MEIEGDDFYEDHTNFICNNYVFFLVLMTSPLSKIILFVIIKMIQFLLLFVQLGHVLSQQKNWNTFRSHISRNMDAFDVDPRLENSSVAHDENSVPFNDQDALQQMNANYTLSLQVKHNFSDLAIDSVVQSTNLLLEKQALFFKKMIKRELTSEILIPSF
jgi:hypothetical protein